MVTPSKVKFAYPIMSGSKARITTVVALVTYLEYYMSAIKLAAEKMSERGYTES